MFKFLDDNGYVVELDFEGPYKIQPKHVLVLVRREGKWLCAVNKKRGIEFPGGKVEEGETLEEAAIREVYEETAVHISGLEKFAHYVVYDDKPFCKVVFTARVIQADEFIEQHETLGRLWLTQQELENHPDLSFYMKDEGMKMMLQEVKRSERKWND